MANSLPFAGAFWQGLLPLPPSCCSLEVSGCIHIRHALELQFVILLCFKLLASGPFSVFGYPGPFDKVPFIPVIPHSNCPGIFSVFHPAGFNVKLQLILPKLLFLGFTLPFFPFINGHRLAQGLLPLHELWHIGLQQVHGHLHAFLSFWPRLQFLLLCFDLAPHVYVVLGPGLAVCLLVHHVLQALYSFSTAVCSFCCFFYLLC